MPDSKEVIEFGEPTTHQDGDTFGFEWDTDGKVYARILIDSVHEDTNGIMGWVTVWWLLDQPLGIRPVAPRAKVKLDSQHSTGWSTIHRSLEKDWANVRWSDAMRIAVTDTMEMFKAGAEAVTLGRTDIEFGEPFILKPYIANSGTSVIYGAGGLAKSLLALGMAVSVSTGVPIFGTEPVVVGPVIYFDYEDDSDAHDVRLRALCRNFGIPIEETNIIHFPLATKVTTSKLLMKEAVKAHGAVLGILDSIGMARGGSAVAAEDTVRLFRTLRSIGVPFLAIDHVSKEAKRDGGGDVDAYGSIYTMNSARLAWSLVEQATGRSMQGKTILARNTKANHVRRMSDRTLIVNYKNDSLGRPEFIEIEMSNELGLPIAAVGTHERMMMLLSHGEWMTYKQVSESLGLADSTIRGEVHRDKGSPDPDFEVRGKAGMPSEVRCCKIVATPHATPLDDDWDDREIQ